VQIAEHVAMIVCDDMRNEQDNKVSLMGIYPHKLKINEIPTVIPRLTFCVLLDKLITAVGKCEIVAKGLENEIEPISQTIEPKQEAKAGTNLRIVFAVYPVEIRATGTIVFQVRMGGEEHPSLEYKLEIIKQEPPR